MKPKKQICTFPYALHSTSTFNSKAYPCQIDGGYTKPDYFTVWSPVHYGHHLGRYKTREAAQRKADEINERKSEWVYLGHLSGEEMQPVYKAFGIK